jgi:hypothetical protein
MPVSIPGRLTLLAIGLILTACQPVPLATGGSNPEKPRPVKPLPWKGAGTVQGQKTTTPGFQVADTNGSAKKTTKPKPSANKPGTSGLDPATIAAKLAEATDKAESALSMQQSAQTQEDWNLVFDRWKLAIQMAKAIPGKNPPVQQKIAEFQQGLAAATQDAKISLNPSLAPVDQVGANAKGVIGVPAAPDQNAKPTPTASPNPTASPAAKPNAAPNPNSPNPKP